MLASGDEHNGLIARLDNSRNAESQRNRLGLIPFIASVISIIWSGMRNYPVSLSVFVKAEIQHSLHRDTSSSQ